MSTTDRTDGREAIGELTYLYAEAVDTLGCRPVRAGEEDSALEPAANLFAQCLAEDVKVRRDCPGFG